MARNTCQSLPSRQSRKRKNTTQKSGWRPRQQIGIANSSRKRQRRSTSSTLQPPPGSMALMADTCRKFWEEEIEPEVLAAYDEAYEHFPQRDGPHDRPRVWSSTAVRIKLYGAPERSRRWGRLRTAVREIIDSFIKFYLNAESSAVPRPILGKIKFFSIKTKYAIRISKAIYEVDEYKNHFSDGALHPHYLTGWLWDNRIATLVEKAPLDFDPSSRYQEQHFLPSIKELCLLP
ncbi:hypothetical protein AOL_s00091g43 [Orbilia oligospora ATCC 24927]|uniref:Uncharacterized protein n=1 Tax=Arthrobotrys oligospora (strain ATCC 24927 / CBS 115.81 / DSM 1491) TaxID=756982 RepID=G1XHZ1_ARTOA|nr:hypothetical protein AOL_s00091g43 [Orbilia oligospora ATCC 24927]EGX47222.1 hypothetical protein AOL_s00091g43 [Orbilia oligospora ATCC 24927]